MACLFLAALLAIPAAAQNSCCAPNNTCACDCDANCADDCDCDCEECSQTGVRSYVRVDGFSRLYQVMINGAAQDPPAFVWGMVNPQGSSAVMPAAYQNGSYLLALTNSGLFLVIEGDSPMDSFDFEQGFIWYGPDGILGTDDDQIISLEDMLDDVRNNVDGFTVEMWNSMSIVIPGWPVIASEDADVDADDDDDDEDDDDNNAQALSGSNNNSTNNAPGLPQTGIELTPGAMIAAAIVALGAGYVGISYAKKRKEDKAAA